MKEWRQSFCFKAGKTATETVEIVRAAYGDEALTRSDIFTGMDGFMKGGKMFKMTTEVVAPLSLERTATSKTFGSCCCKIVTYHFG